MENLRKLDERIAEGEEEIKKLEAEKAELEERIKGFEERAAEVLGEKAACQEALKGLEAELARAKDDFNVMKRDLAAIDGLEATLRE